LEKAKDVLRTIRDYYKEHVFRSLPPLPPMPYAWRGGSGAGRSTDEGMGKPGGWQILQGSYPLT